MSSAWFQYCRAKCARSWVYKLVWRGSSFPGPGWWCVIVCKSNLYNVCPLLPFIVTRGGAQREGKSSYSVRQLVVPSYVIICQAVLKLGLDVLSGKPPCGRVGLFTLGPLAFSLSSLVLP
jgi:hypothetical protein